MAQGHENADMPSVANSETELHSNRYPVLDGWRGISILLVLATHMMPVGPKAWQFNETTGPMGMAIFFTLSGFLITTFLLKSPSVVDFLIRRFFRIVPLAWVCMVIVLLASDAATRAYFAHFLFYANLPPSIQLTEIGSHLWSLCVEVQFYVGVALLFWALGVRGLLILPGLCLAVTAFRIAMGEEISIVTWWRIDEILAGATLALVIARRFGEKPLLALQRLNPYVLLLLLAVASHPVTGFANYLRPYFAAVLVGITLCRTDARLDGLLRTRALAYVAAISYALYVIHPLLGHSWLGEGDKIVKYLKRPLLFALLFLLAHASTFYFEQRCIDFGKRLSARFAGKRGVQAAG